MEQDDNLTEEELDDIMKIMDPENTGQIKFMKFYEMMQLAIKKVQKRSK